jgi:hypothetical protein
MWTPEKLAKVEVLGANLQAILDGFGSFSVIASRVLLDSGLGTEKDGVAHFQKDKWYPLNPILEAFERITQGFGVYTLRQVGSAVPKNALFPPNVVDIDSALQAVDVAYHMNHAIGGQALFSPQSGQMTEGIGHYGFERVPDKKQIVSTCDSPYPCGFDAGLLLAMAQRFEPTATLVHSTAGCRNQGADSCTYTLTWK